MSNIIQSVEELKEHIYTICRLEDLTSSVAKEIFQKIHAIERICREIELPEKEEVEIQKILTFLKESDTPLKEMKTTLDVLLNRLKEDSLSQVVAYLIELELLIFPSPDILPKEQEDFLKKIAVLKNPALSNLQKKIISNELKEISKKYSKIIPIEESQKAAQIKEVREKIDQIAKKSLPETTKKEQKKSAG